MTIFDKACALAAVLLGLLLLTLGAIGLFAGCSANFSLPPVLGIVPAFVGWGIIRPVYLAWTLSNRTGTAQPPSLPPRSDPDALQ